jgi:hypothetical protein
MPMIVRFGFWWSHWILAYSFHRSWVFWVRVPLFFLWCVFYLWALRFLSSTCSSLLEWPSTMFLVCQKGLFISRISVWFFFLRFSISLFNSSFIFCVVFFISYISLLYCPLFYFGVCRGPLWIHWVVSVSSQVFYLWCGQIYCCFCQAEALLLYSCNCLISSSPSKKEQFNLGYSFQSWEASSVIHLSWLWEVRLLPSFSQTLLLFPPLFTESSAPCPTLVLWGMFSIPPHPHCQC